MAITQATVKRPRLDWPDVAKGVSILGVVLLHVSLAVPQGMDTLAANLNHVLDPLRMPLFFLVSGFFSVKVLNFSLRELFTRRLWFFLVPYLVWVPVELWFKFREYQMFDGTPMPGISTYLEHIFEARNMYWFLFALTVFNLFLWCTRRLPPWAGILASFTPILILPLHSDLHMVGKAVLYLPAFMIGVHLRARIADHAENALSPRRFLPAAGAYLAGFTLLVLWAAWTDRTIMEIPWLLPGAETIGNAELRLIINMMVQLLMIPSAIAVAVALSKIPVLADVLKFLGRHTLVIYLGHPIALTVLYHYNMRASDLEITRGADTLLGSTAFWMLVGLVISVIGSVAFWVMSRIPVLSWTIMPPRLRLPGGTRAGSGTRRTQDAATADRLPVGARPDPGDASPQA